MAESNRWVRTHCSRMDHGGCALFVQVQDGAVVGVKPDPEGYLNQGYACPKGLRGFERLRHPDRLLRPLKRQGERGEGRWVEISWDDALEEIASAFKRIRDAHGAEAVAFCQGMPKGLEHFVLIRLANCFGSPNVVAVQDVCHAPREVSGLHTCGFYPVVDFHQASALFLVWGSHPPRTNEEGAIGHLLLERVREGAELIVVDPRRSDLARRADLWLQVRPGGDGALALAFLNVVMTEGLYDQAFVAEWTHGFEELKAHVAGFTPEALEPHTWVPPEKVREAAKRYAAKRPAAIQWGNPLEHHAGTFDTLRSMVCLMAVCGNLDVPGGNVQANEPPIQGLAKFVRADLIPWKRERMIHAHHGAIPRLMTVPPAYFKRAVLHDDPYPVRGAYVQCSNPLLGYAGSLETEKALRAVDFLAVADIFMTPTAALADIVLPAATQYEFNDIGHYGLGHGIVLARPKVAEPPGECRPDMQILTDLGRLMTGPELWPDDHERFLEDLLAPAGLSYAAFVEAGYLKGPARFRKYRDGGFKTPSGKVELRLSQAERFGLKPLPVFDGLPGAQDADYPLVLTSAKSPCYLHSSYRWVEALRRLAPRPVVELHPSTAQAAGVREGEEILVETRAGAIRQTARLSEAVDPRVVYADYGWWFPEEGGWNPSSWQRANFNMLTSTARVGREFGTPNLKGIACRVRRIA